MLALALDDLRQRGPHRAPDAEQVDLEDPLPLLDADLPLAMPLDASRRRDLPSPRCGR